ncbi:MAG: hypothetical protein WD708_03235 [Kiritimatiellia bacterium]
MNRFVTHFKFDVRFWLGLAVILLVLWISVDLVFLKQDRDRFEILPPSVPVELSPVQDELPQGYGLVQDEDLLKEMHLESNPGYLLLPAEQAALAEWGGLCSIAAIYSRNGEVRLMLNGVYFRNAEDCESFIQTEIKKKLQLAAFKKTLPSGVWLLFIASDVDQTYSEAERTQFRAMLDRYRRRLGMEALFDHLSQAPRDV